MPRWPTSAPRFTLPSAQCGVGLDGGGGGLTVAGAWVARGCVGALGGSCANDGAAATTNAPPQRTRRTLVEIFLNEPRSLTVCRTIDVTTFFKPASLLPQSVHEQHAAGGNRHVLLPVHRV